MSDGTEISLEGVDEIISRLNAMNVNMNKLANDALRAAAVPVLEDAKTTSAFVDRTGKLRRMLSMSPVRTKEGMKYILVGVDKGDISEIYYAKFIEWGTSRMSARPFLDPAYQHNKYKVLRIIKEKLKEGLR